MIKFAETREHMLMVTYSLLNTGELIENRHRWLQKKMGPIFCCRMSVGFV